jgi:hypothetical protein
VRPPPETGNGPPPGPATAEQTIRHHSAGPDQGNPSGQQQPPVTAGDGHAHVDPAWIEQLERDQAEEAKIRDAVHRLIARATCVHGLLRVGSPEFWRAPATVQLASIAVWGQGYVPEHPVKQAAVATSGALNWRAGASRPSYAELQRLRSVPVTPVRCQDPGGCTRVHYVEHPIPEVVLCDRHPRTQRAGAVA